MNRLFLISLSIFCLTFSCKKKETESPKTLTSRTSSTDNDAGLTLEETAALQFVSGNHKITPEEAEDIAMNLVAEASENSKSSFGLETVAIRSISSKVVMWYDVAISMNNLNRLETDSIPLYIYHFKTSIDSTAGFAIISGDNRLPLVFACTMDGAVKDTANATGAKILLANIPAYMKNEIIRRQLESKIHVTSALKKIKAQLPDSLQKIIGDEIRLSTNARLQSLPYWSLENVQWGNTVNVISLNPIVKTKWGQDKPYNYQVPLYCFDRFAPTGCVATTMAQIMKYYQYPKIYEGVNLRYDIMGPLGIGQPDYTGTDAIFPYIADLMVATGKASNTMYFCNGSAASTEGTIQGYLKMGYQVRDRTYINYDLAIVKNYLTYRSPVHIQGCDFFNFCHAWILDGYVYLARPWVGKMVLYSNNTPIGSYMTSGINYEDLVWCNFGWEGKADGLYLNGIFNIGRQDLPKSADPSNPTLYNKLAIIPYFI